MTQPRILKIGLTGGMGCGKSEVRRLLAAQGIPTIDADTLAKEIAATDPRTVAAIQQAFGDDVYDASGRLRREVLAARVFGKPEALERLNRIVHPRVFEVVDEKVRELAEKGEPLVVIEAALFYETGWDREMNAMIVVTAPLEKRLTWLQRRDGASRDQIEARLQHQMPVEEKARRADFVLENNGSLEELRKKVKELVRWLLGRVQKA